MNITRRDFFRRAAGAIALGAGGSWALAASVGEDKEWAFPFLGDLHIDQPDHHDMDWLGKEHPNDVSQVKNYCRITREVTPVGPGFGADQPERQIVPPPVQLSGASAERRTVSGFGSSAVVPPTVQLGAGSAQRSANSSRGW